MKLKIDEILKTCIMLNKSTLVLKFNCLTHPNDIEKMRVDLQSQCTGIEVVILPNEVDVADDNINTEIISEGLNIVCDVSKEGDIEKTASALGVWLLK
jgi:hypothetical protein